MTTLRFLCKRAAGLACSILKRPVSLALLLLALGTLGRATAATLTVTTNLDAVAGSLRAAITSAHAGDTITFAANLSGQTITLTNGQLLVRSNLTIDASALATNVSISGNNASRVLLVTNSATVVLKSLGINNGGVTDGFGGGIYNSTNCNLTLSNCLLWANSATGGVAAAGANNSAGDGGAASPGGSGWGGAIFNAGMLTVNRCVLSNNAAAGSPGGRGGNGGTVAFQPGGSGGNGGGGGSGCGGGIYNDVTGTLTVSQSTFSNNSANGGSGGNGGDGGTGTNGFPASQPIQLINGQDGGNGGDGGSAGPGYGGSIYNAGILTLNQNTISGSSVHGGGGGFGGHGGKGGMGLNQTPFPVFGTDVVGRGGVGGDGGGAANGGPGNGGGIYSVGMLTFNQNTLSGNSAVGGNGGNGGIGGNGGAGGNSGGVNPIFPGPGGQGGASTSGGSGGLGAGGGIYNAGTSALNQITLSGNSANNSSGGGLPGGGNGGAGGLGSGSVPNGFPGGPGARGQQAPDSLGQGGGLYNANASSCTLRNCLIAGNSATGSPDASGTLASQGHNLLGRSGDSTGLIDGVNDDLVGTFDGSLDPLLGPLTNNGGPTLTLAPQPGSPALEAGDDSITNSFDQRGAGFLRLRGPHVDIGAVEFSYAGYSTPTIATQSAGGVTLDPTTRLSRLTISASVNPNGLAASAWLQYGVNTIYGSTTTPLALGGGTNNVPASLPLADLAPGFIWHYRVVAASGAGTTLGSDRTAIVGTPGGGLSGIVGDVDGNGVVDATELGTVLTNYNSGVAASNAYSLYTQAQINATNQSGIAAGISMVTNSPNSYNLYTFAQYTNNGATNFTAGRATGRADVTNFPNTYNLYTFTQYTNNGATNFSAGVGAVTNSPGSYNLYTFTQYTNNGATNFTAGRAAGRADVTNSPNTYGLYSFTQYTNNGATNFSAGVAIVTNSPNSYNLYTLTQYTNNGATNFTAGRATGRADVTNSPNTYNLFTLAQYNTNGATNFSAGVGAVTNSPSSYNLYTFTQYTNNGATNFIAGRTTGRADVTNSPNTYGLYTVSQLQALDVNAPLLAKNPTNGVFKLTIGVQRATQLTNFVDFPMNGAGFSNSINAAGKLEFNFTDPSNAAFFRLQSH
jgi:hypothetical protein